LQKAKLTKQNTGQLRERIASIRSLCELVLEEENGNNFTSIVNHEKSIQASLQNQKMMTQIPVVQPIHNEEDSGSLLDF
jgi:hypothetical protein